MAMLVGGFGTIAAGVMAAYIGMGISATHLLTASLLGAPASLVIAKILYPETERPVTQKTCRLVVEEKEENIFHAATNGASNGLMLALNVAAMLLAFMATIALANDLVHYIGTCFNPANKWYLDSFLGYCFYPFAWLIGIPAEDCSNVGKLLGMRMLFTEYNSYETLSQWMKETGDNVPLHYRSQILATYALCGFATLASIGIQIGGIGALVPERKKDLAKLGFKAMLGGNLCCMMIACVAGVMLTDDQSVLQSQLTQDSGILVSEKKASGNESPSMAHQIEATRHPRYKTSGSPTIDLLDMGAPDATPTESGESESKSSEPAPDAKTDEAKK